MQTAIVIVSYNGQKWLGQCLKSCQTCSPDVPVYVVDNASIDGSAAIAAAFAGVTVLRQEVNLGFTGGNNVGIRAAINDGAEAVMLLNQDAELTNGCLDALEKYLIEHATVAAVQPAIMLPNGKVNSLGNSFHFLGFAEAGGNGLSLAEASRKLPWIVNHTEPPYVSGAAVLLRSEALHQVGLFDEALFLYHEDLELCLRFRLAGWQLAVLPEARVMHNYEPQRSLKQYFYMERNRLIVWNEIFQVPTLLLFLPIFILSEIALLFSSIIGGWFKEKILSYVYFLQPSSWHKIKLQRRNFMNLRKISDSELLFYASAKIEYQEKKTGILTHLIWNPASSFCWLILKSLIRW